jgi:hypothetical protein
MLIGDARVVRTKYHIGCRQLSRKAHSNVGCALKILWGAAFYWICCGKVDAEAGYYWKKISRQPE